MCGLQVPFSNCNSVTVTEKTCSHGVPSPVFCPPRKCCLFVVDDLHLPSSFFSLLPHLLSSLPPVLSPDSCPFLFSLAASAKCCCAPHGKYRETSKYIPPLSPTNGLINQSDTTVHLLCAQALPHCGEQQPPHPNTEAALCLGGKEGSGQLCKGLGPFYK